MENVFKLFLLEETGQDLIEYALLAALMSVICIAAIRLAGTKVSTLYAQVEAGIP